MSLLRTFDGTRIIICCGSGGVGKTSMSAALGLLAAQEGRKVLVLTVDPARRLATALGVTLEDNAENRIPPELLKGAGLDVPGEFYAMMLNAKKTFDDLVHRYASSPEARQTLLNNPTYVHGSTALIGSPEYMATEKIHELYHERDYDLIIVDTPPLKHALDFLTAPTRFQGMLTGNPLIRLLIDTFGQSKGRGSFLGRMGKASLFRALSLVTGEKAIQDAGEFFGAFHTLMGGFTDRARRMNEIFCSAECSLLVITSPNLITIEEALFLHERIAKLGMGFRGFIVNRAEPEYFGAVGSEPDPDALLAELNAEARVDGVPPELLDVLLANMRHHAVRRRTEGKNLALLERELSGSQFLHRVPELPQDIADIQGLAKLGEHLLEEKA